MSNRKANSSSAHNDDQHSDQRSQPSCHPHSKSVGHQAGSLDHHASEHQSEKGADTDNANTLGLNQEVEKLRRQIGLEEREFLHDLSNPLAIAYGMIDAVLEDTFENNQLSESQVRRLGKARNALSRTLELMKARRARILAMQAAHQQQLGGSNNDSEQQD